MNERNDREKVIDEIFCEYFGITWNEIKGKGGRVALWTDKTVKGKRQTLVTEFDGTKLLQAVYIHDGTIRAKYTKIDELLTAAHASEFGRKRRKTPQNRQQTGGRHTMTQQQIAAIKAITRANSGKKATRPELSHGFTYDGKTVYYTDGFRIAKVNTITADGLDVIDATNPNSNYCQLRQIWEYQEKIGKDEQTATLPTLDELRAADGTTFTINGAIFNRKYLMDFVKLCKTKIAKLLTVYRYNSTEKSNYILMGASPDGTAESLLLSYRADYQAPRG